jgi:putative membrane protein
MKIKFLSLLIVGGLMFACDPSPNREDTKETAEDQNEERIEATSTGNTADDKEDDAEFVVEAASGGMMEVQLANLALQKASSPQVKEFARMMIEDHGKANNELKALAASKNITLPAALIDKHQKIVNGLQDKTGTDFDEEYIDKMRADHKDDVDEFEEASKEATDPDIKAFAAKTLPTLRTHLQHAEQLDGKKSTM